MADHSRDPCPIVIVSDFGGAFAMGVIGGTLWHGVKGFRNSPSGERRIGALSAIRARAPVVGGNFGSWGGVFATCDCAVKGIRRKEDPFNAIIAGFMTGGLLAMRGGVKHARNNAIASGILLAAFEGVGIVIGRMLAPPSPMDAAAPMPA
ncbi:mitochondrial inner membrane translocase subunit Tim17/Tim22/Tim23/peroxisomal protein PMP24 [Lipomyces oligophaga]|uniref:mitochondrial inner membrane translocase subunit Tim17/Tim22/Tim23/peroxisomal protein PMP24 n=1 Tax=Lipomyces oligophaga TaxID=45792 RepID=UPI0034CDB1B1